MSITRETITRAIEEKGARMGDPEAFMEALLDQFEDDWQPVYSPWRHGGWYVDNLHYPSGAVGCVSRNYADKKWRIACDPRPFEEAPTFRNRDEAAKGERDLIASEIVSTAGHSLKV